MKPMVKARTTTIDQYLATQPAPARRALRQVRSTVGQAVPDAVEAISYGMPAFKLRGRILLYFAGWKEHWALYPGSGAVVALLGEALAPFEVAKGTIRFPLGRPVPGALVARIARLRARMVAEQQPVRGAAPRRRRRA
jgi:uncharacterized protein YdhG (YjbR/CyaY superfamily)